MWSIITVANVTYLGYYKITDGPFPDILKILFKIILILLFYTYFPFIYNVYLVYIFVVSLSSI